MADTPRSPNPGEEHERDISSPDFNPTHQQNRPDGSEVQSPDDLDAREQAPDQSWRYRPQTPGDNSKTRLRQLSRQLKRPKGILGVLGIGGGLMGVAVTFSFLLPFRVASLVESTIDLGGSEVKHVVELRAEHMLARAVLGDAAVPYKGPWKTLVATVRTSRFEKRLADKGLTLQRTPDGVKLFQNGRPLGGGRPLKREGEIMRALNAGGPVDNSVLKALVRNDFSVWRWHQRAKFTKFLRKKYNIKRFGTKENDDKNKTPQQRAELTNADMERQSLEARANQAGRAITQVTGDSGSPGDNSIADATAEAGKEAAGTITPGNTGSDAVTKAVTKSLTKKLVLAAFGVGAITTASAINEKLRNEASGSDTALSKTVSNYKKADSVIVAAQMFGDAHQIRAGQMSPELVGIINHKFDGENSNDPSAEQSQTQNAINGHPELGVPLAESEKVNENRANALHEMAVAYMNSGGIVLDPPLHLWYVSIGKITSLIGDKVDAAARTALIKIGIPVDDILSGMVDWIKNQLFGLIGINLSPPHGARLMNKMGQGSVAGFNDYAQDIGMRKFAGVQATQQLQQIAADDKAYDASQGLAYNFFDANNTHSFVNQAAMKLPLQSENTPAASFTTTSLAMITRLPGNVAALLSPPASALDYGYHDLYGIDVYGGTDADLAQEVDATGVSGGDCPSVPHDGSTYDNCNIDKTIAEGIECAPDFSDNAANADCSGGLDELTNSDGGTPTPGPGGGTIVSGDTKALALKILHNPNIGFQNDHDKDLFAKIAETGTQDSSCGSQVAISPTLLGVLEGMGEANKFKFKISVVAAEHGCDSGYHPKGMAADLVNVSSIDGSVVTPNNQLHFDALNGAQMNLVKSFYAFIADSFPANTGGLGQTQCFAKYGGSSPPPRAGVQYFPDECSHIHMDVRGSNS